MKKERTSEANESTHSKIENKLSKFLVIPLKLCKGRMVKPMPTQKLPNLVDAGNVEPIRWQEHREMPHGQTGRDENQNLPFFWGDD